MLILKPSAPENIFSEKRHLLGLVATFVTAYLSAAAVYRYIVDIIEDIGYTVTASHYLPFQRFRQSIARMVNNGITYIQS